MDPLKPTWREKTDLWIHANPRAWSYFKKFAREYYNAGRKTGIAAIRERVRWEVQIKHTGKFKINNNMSPHLTRRLILECPELVDTITQRIADES